MILGWELTLWNLNVKPVARPANAKVISDISGFTNQSFTMAL